MDPFGLIALLIPYAGMFTGVIFMMLVYKLVARWQDRRAVPGYDEVVADLARLRAEVGRMDGMTERVQELEERLDFAERMLTRRTGDALPPGA